MAHQHSLGH